MYDIGGTFFDAISSGYLKALMRIYYFAVHHAVKKTSMPAYEAHSDIVKGL